MLKRFNIFPEFFLSFFINNIDDYIKASFLLNSILYGVLFLFTQEFNMGIFGILANIIFIVKKNELTRVLQSPALRESFGLPFYFFHLYFLTIYIKYNFFLFIIPSFIFSILSFLSWQFIKVVFFIEICILFGTESLGILYQYQVITIYIHLFLVVIVSYLLKYKLYSEINSITFTTILSALILTVYTTNSFYGAIIRCSLLLIISSLLKYILNYNSLDNDEKHIYTLFYLN